jgi:anaerobic selenocysteine-containing dehydrogenase
VTQPLRRRGDGGFEPIPWDAAFALAGERLAAIQREHGASAVGAYLGNPNVHHFGHIAYAPALLKTLRTPNVFSASSVDQWPHQLVAAQMYGHQFLLPVPDVDRTHFFLMLGANPIVSNGSLMTAPGIADRLDGVRERGKWVVIDPRRTETAARASEHHFIRPGTDAMFLLALLQALLELGPPRIERYEGKLERLDVALDAVRRFDRAALAARCGIEPSTIARLAAEFHAAPAAVCYGRMGVSTQPFGTLCQWLIQLVNLVTGNLDREGGLLPNEPVVPVTGPGTSAGQRARWRSRVRQWPEFAGELPVSVLREEIETPGEGRIRAMVTIAGNPLLSTPDGTALDRAFASLDFMLAIDVYINETTRHADLILPPASFLSQPHYDLIFNAFAVRRVARWNAPLRAQRNDERADWQIFNALAGSIAEQAGKPFQPLPPPEALVAGGLKRGGSGLEFAALASAPHGLDLGPLQPSLLRRLETASGRIDAAPALFLEDLPRLAAALQETLPPDALLLIGRRDIRSNNSWMHNAPRLVKGKPRHHLLMHPADLAARGLADGAPVRVRSRSGELRTEVRATADLAPGVACLPHGYGHDRPGVRQVRARALEGASYNDLTDPAALDAPSGNAGLNALPVWVEPA